MALVPMKTLLTLVSFLALAAPAFGRVAPEPPAPAPTIGAVWSDSFEPAPPVDHHCDRLPPGVKTPKDCAPHKG